MICREPVSIAWAIIAVLSLLFPGFLGGWLYEKHSAECHAKNERLLSEGRQGPMEEC